MNGLMRDFQINVRYLDAKVMRRSEMELKALSRGTAARNAERIVFSDCAAAEIISMEIIDIALRASLAPRLVVSNKNFSK
jgi:hypothetical protein